MTDATDTEEVFRAFKDLEPLLAEVASIMRACPLTGRKAQASLAVMVFIYFGGIAVSRMDRVADGRLLSSAEELVGILANVLLSADRDHQEEPP